MSSTAENRPPDSPRLVRAVAYATAGLGVALGLGCLIGSLWLFTSDDTAPLGLYGLAISALLLTSIPTNLALATPGKQARAQAVTDAKMAPSNLLGMFFGLVLIGAGAGAVLGGVVGAVVGAMLGVVIASPFGAFGLFRRQIDTAAERRWTREQLSSTRVRKAVSRASVAYSVVLLSFVSVCMFAGITRLV